MATQSTLEKALLGVTPADHPDLNCDDINLLKEILQGTAGTKKQRDLLLRILSQVRKPKSECIAPKLARQLQRAGALAYHLVELYNVGSSQPYAELQRANTQSIPTTR